MMETLQDPLAMPGNPVSMPASPVSIPGSPIVMAVSPVPRQTDAIEVKQPAKKTSKRTPAARFLVLGAIRQLKNAKGSSFADIKKYLGEKYDSDDIGDVNRLKAFVENAVAKGILEKINSRYKIKELATRSQASKGKSSRKNKSVSGSKKGTSSKSSEKRKQQKSAIKEVKPEAKKPAKKANRPKKVRAEHVSDD